MPEENPLAGIPCRDCGEARLRIEMRDQLVARPLGSHSLSGAQLKLSAYVMPWPWAVCDGCGAESAGKR